MRVETVGKGIAVEDEISGLLTDSEYAAGTWIARLLCCAGRAHGFLARQVCLTGVLLPEAPCKLVLEETANPSWFSWYLGVPSAGTYPPRYSMICERIAVQTNFFTNEMIDKQIAVQTDC